MPNFEAMSARDSPVWTTYTPEGEEMMPRRGPGALVPAAPFAAPRAPLTGPVAVPEFAE